MNRKYVIVSLTAVLIAGLAASAVLGEAAPSSSCLKCHTDYKALLEATGDKNKADDVYVEKAFLDSVHGKEDCSSCHKGDTAGTKDKAHAGMVVDPTEDGGTVSCAPCHSTITAKFKTSIHFTANGIRSKLLARAGSTSDKETKVNQMMGDCGSCHATCGQCHVSKPTFLEGGLIKGHSFIKYAPNEDTCLNCHDEFGPQYANFDVHKNKGLECVTCHHNENELHGTGKLETSMYNATDVDCLTCHQKVGDKSDKVAAHKAHKSGKLNCYACHAQLDVVSNCFGCHNGELEKEVKGAKLALWPNGKIGPVEHVPASVDFVEGITLDSKSVKAIPMWVPTTPHTIAKTTAQNKSCEACHNNPNFFLSKEDVGDEPCLEMVIDAKKISKILGKK